MYLGLWETGLDFGLPFGVLGIKDFDWGSLLKIRRLSHTSPVTLVYEQKRDPCSS